MTVPSNGTLEAIRSQQKWPISWLLDVWRRERNCRQTLSGAFSMTYEPHKLRWMLPGESRGCHGSSELRADACRAGRATAKPDLSKSDASEPARDCDGDSVISTRRRLQVADGYGFQPPLP